ncbi:MAG: hypothetical protein K6E36_07605 [Oscillospiraceae bacterium]|nr:hypothetical protein [Oscillospiraceae bacterium]MCR5306344.1 hypothetical protein [Oscillospiraceae bacterium]
MDPENFRPEEPEIDIAIDAADTAAPSGGPPKESRTERREAIAKARAIRREAAAQEREAKKRAAAEAKALVAQAKAEARKKERRSQTKNTLGNTGVFRWLDALRKATGEEPSGERRGDTEELVAVLAAEKKAALLSDKTGEIDAIVEQLAAEQNLQAAAPEHPETAPVFENVPDLDDESPAAVVDAIVAQVAAHKGIEVPDEAGLPEPEVPAVNTAAAESVSPAAVRSGHFVDEIVAKLAAENPPEETPEEPPVSYVDAITEARRQRLQQVTSGAEEEEPAAPPAAVPSRAVSHEREMELAAAQFRQDTAAAKQFTRKLARRTERSWRHEAAAEQARLSRPQTRRRAAAVNTAACLVMFFGIAAGMLLLERPTVSEIENRKLAEMPDFSVAGYLSGDYTGGVAEYYNDTVPFRSVFKNITAVIRQHMGLQKDQAVLHGGAPVREEDDPAVTTAVTEDPLAYLSQTSYTTATTGQEGDAQQGAEDDKDEGEMSRKILVAHKRGIMLYGGSFANGERYASYLNKYQEQLGSGVQVWSMVAPTPCSFYTPEKFQSMIGSEKKNIDHINEHLVGAKGVDIYSALEKHQDEPIFMRTDHHWSALGAFYSAEAFSAAARVPFARMSDYDKVVKPGYVGTLYGYSGDATLKNNPEDFFYYVPHAEFSVTYWNRSLGAKRDGSLFIKLDKVPVSDWYMVYLGGDDRVTRVQTGVKNGRKLAVIKDSYGNALIPWLTSSFEEITVIDMRFFTKNAISYLKEIGATDVLFAMNTFSATGGNAKEIDKIRRQ